MNNLFFVFLFLIPVFSLGQFPFDEKDVPSGEPDIYYYKFYNGIQMIEFDYLTAYHRKVNFLEQTQPRALTWQMVLGPPHPNVFMFRNEKGDIVKKFGDAGNAELLSVSKSKEIAVTHNSVITQTGNVSGFSRGTTRYFPYYIIGSVPGVNLPGSLGLIDSLGNEVLPQEYNVVWKHDNIFITRKGTTNELRDSELNIRFSSDEYRLQPAQFHKGFADIFKEDKCGLLNSSGKIIVPCKYDMIIGAFNKYGLAEVKKDHRIGYVDITGKEVIECKYQSVGSFKGGLLNIRYNDKWGYIDERGKTIIPHQYDIGQEFSEGLARVAKREAGLWYFGFIDKKGNIVIPLTYSNAKDFKKGIAEVMVDGKWIKIDEKGNKLE